MQQLLHSSKIIHQQLPALVKIGLQQQLHSSKIIHQQLPALVK